jgi:hypothetical protein
MMTTNYFNDPDEPPSEGLVGMIEELRRQMEEDGRAEVFQSLCNHIWSRLADLFAANDGAPGPDFNEALQSLFGPGYEPALRSLLKLDKRARRPKKPKTQLVEFKRPDPPNAPTMS